MRAVGYCRVSTREQAREGWSLPEQRRRVEAYCEARGWEMVDVYSDAGASGKAGARRPQFERMVRDVLADGVDRVVALKLDRLGRSARDLLNLYDRLEARGGVGIVFVDDSIDTSTANGRLFRTMLAAFAEWERDTISERTKTMLEGARLDGKHIGRPPFGHRHDGHGRLVEDPAEQRTLARIRALAAEGKGVRAIAAALDAEGVPTRKPGATWRPATVGHVLRREGLVDKPPYRRRHYKHYA